MNKYLVRITGDQGDWMEMYGMDTYEAAENFFRENDHDESFDPIETGEAICVQVKDGERVQTLQVTGYSEKVYSASDIETEAP